MTHDEMVTAVTEALQLPGNVTKLMRRTIVDMLPQMNEEQLAAIMQDLDLPVS